MLEQPRPTIPGAIQALEETGLEAVSERRLHYPSILTTESPPPLPVEPIFSPSPQETKILLMPNQVVPEPLSNSYAYLYSYN